ncbi:MAG: hypothetical protein AAGA57_10590 [Planctomycetota bacterium]
MAPHPHPLNPESPDAPPTPEARPDVRQRAQAYRLVRQAQAALEEARNRCAQAWNHDAQTGAVIDARPTPEAEAALDQAVAAFRQALDLAGQAPPAADAHAGLARIAMLRDDIEAADQALSDALDADPARDDLLAERMTLRLDAGDMRQARQDLERLESLGSDLAHGWRDELDALEA